MLLGAVAARYRTEIATKAAEEERTELERAIAREKGRINTLHSEIAHLETPERLAALQYLSDAPLSPATPMQLADLDAALLRIEQAEALAPEGTANAAATERTIESSPSVAAPVQEFDRDTEDLPLAALVARVNYSGGAGE